MEGKNFHEKLLASIMYLKSTWSNCWQKLTKSTNSRSNFVSSPWTSWFCWVIQKNMEHSRGEMQYNWHQFTTRNSYLNHTWLRISEFPVEGIKNWHQNPTVCNVQCDVHPKLNIYCGKLLIILISSCESSHFQLLFYCCHCFCKDLS